MWRLKIAEGEGPWLKSSNNHIGRRIWEFDPELGTDEERAAVEKAREEFRKNRHHVKQSSDLLMRMQFARDNRSVRNQPKIKVNDVENVREETVKTTLISALNYFSSIQAHDGHWPSELAGPLFLLPMMIIVLHITGTLNVILSSEHQKEICRYFYNHQNKDGGWGFHIEGHSVMFCTTLIYVSLRLLGKEDHSIEDTRRARKWILDHGGAVTIPTWGKTFLAVLGLYEWAGHNPVPPELLLLPKSLPFHPGKFWCHFRLMYLTTSFLYGKKFVGRITNTILALRKELFTCPYDELDWNQARKMCAKEDLYYRHTTTQELLFEVSYSICEPLMSKWPLSRLREMALQTALHYMHYEDDNSSYIHVGAVQKMLSMLCSWVADPSSDAFKRHLARVPDYFWIAEDGMKLQAIGNQTWDAAFAVQAIVSTKLTTEYETALSKAYQFLRQSQIMENPADDFTYWHRHSSKGGWSFSVADQGWSVSDCTAEALKAVLLLADVLPSIKCQQIRDEHLFDAANILLSLQNKDGGFSTWELVRTYPWLEVLNSSELFQDVVIEHSYVECTSSAVQALEQFTRMYPTHRREEIQTCKEKATKFMENIQKNDGSWYGSWGICFTYATWFGIEGLRAGGRTYSNSICIQKACAFLLSKQLKSGGWGESYLSCRDKIYTNLDNNKPHLVNTAWAMLALIKAGQAERNPAPLHHAARYLINNQMENGNFPQQEMSGAFGNNGFLNFATYRNIFPIWALGEYQKHVLSSAANTA